MMGIFLKARKCKPLALKTRRMYLKSRTWAVYLSIRVCRSVHFLSRPRVEMDSQLEFEAARWRFGDFSRSWINDKEKLGEDIRKVSEYFVDMLVGLGCQKGLAERIVR